ncbi:MAG: hypothetical protein GY801_01725 [bacterium]|nr:hypothetical protein [bacterium]
MTEKEIIYCEGCGEEIEGKLLYQGDSDDATVVYSFCENCRNEEARRQEIPHDAPKGLTPADKSRLTPLPEPEVFSPDEQPEGWNT